MKKYEVFTEFLDVFIHVKILYMWLEKPVIAPISVFFIIGLSGDVRHVRFVG